MSTRLQLETLATKLGLRAEDGDGLQHKTDLDLGDNQLTELPPQIEHLKQLTKLNLHSNQLTELPPQIEHLKQLTELGLSNNRLTELPPQIEHLTQLTELSLYDNQLTELPPQIEHLTQLTWLIVHGNQLTELPPQIEHLKQLTRLSVHSNQLTELPPQIEHLTQLTKLSLRSNQLMELPPQIEHLKQLAQLNLGSNQLKELPPQIEHLKQLTVLDLRNNQLTRLPPQIEHLTQLTELNLSSNQLTELPHQIEHLTQLAELNLDGNQLTELPPQIGQIQGLVPILVIKYQNLLRSVNFRCMDLTDKDLGNAVALGADFSNAKLMGTKLRGANLSRADLSGADLSDADLTDAKLCGATINTSTVLKGATLVGADFADVDLTGIDLTEWVLLGAKLLCACGLDFAGTDPLVLDGANMCGADLSDKLLHKCSLKGTDLIGANFKGSTLKECIGLEDAKAGPAFKPPPKCVEAGAEIMEELDLEAAMGEAVDGIEDIVDTAEEIKATSQHSALQGEVVFDWLGEVKATIESTYIVMLESVGAKEPGTDSKQTQEVQAPSRSAINIPGSYRKQARKAQTLLLSVKKSDDRKNLTKMSAEVSRVLTYGAQLLLSEWNHLAKLEIDSVAATSTPDLSSLFAELGAQSAVSTAQSVVEEVHQVLLRQCQKYVERKASKVALQLVQVECTSGVCFSETETLISSGDHVDAEDSGAGGSPGENETCESRLLFNELKVLVQRLHTDLARQVDKSLGLRFLCLGSALVERVRGGVDTMSELRTNASRFERQLKLRLIQKQDGVCVVLDACRAEIRKAEAMVHEIEREQVSCPQAFWDACGCSEDKLKQTRSQLDECRAKLRDTERRGFERLPTYLPQDKLGDMVCIDRVRIILDKETEYSSAHGNWITRLCSMMARVLGRRRSVLTQHENELEYLNERLSKLLDEAVTTSNWSDLTDTWVMLLRLRSRIDSQCGHAILGAMIQDDELLAAIGRVHQFSEANLDEAAKEVMVRALRKGPSSHLKNHAYEYRRKLDMELALIKRLKELQVRAVALLGSSLVAVLIGAANLLARFLYDLYFVATD